MLRLCLLELDILFFAHAAAFCIMEWLYPGWVEKAKIKIHTSKKDTDNRARNDYPVFRNCIRSYLQSPLDSDGCAVSGSGKHSLSFLMRMGTCCFAEAPTTVYM